MTNEFVEVSRQLRDAINSSICFKQQVWTNKSQGHWSMLWCSIDNLQDTQTAINEYRERTIHSYLAKYGLLQAMLVQQDALCHIEEALGLTINLKKDFPQLFLLRTIRHETIGHPTKTSKSKHSEYKNGAVTFTSITRNEDLTGMEYGVWSNTGFQHKHINLMELIDTQSTILIEEMKKIIKHIKQADKTHKKKFQGELLYPYLSQTNYYIQKLPSYEDSRSYARINFDFLCNQYGKFKLALQERYSITDFNDCGLNISGLLYTIQHIDRLLPRIEKMVDMGSNVDPLDLDVYVESLRSSFVELEDMSKEIDDEFSK